MRRIIHEIHSQSAAIENAGCTLAEQDLRRRYGILVLSVISGDGRRALPDPRVALQASDRLYVLCTEAALTAMRDGREPPLAAPGVVAAVSTASHAFKCNPYRPPTHRPTPGVGRWNVDYPHERTRLRDRDRVSRWCCGSRSDAWTRALTFPRV